MAGLDLVLRGGTVCTPGARARADVAIRDGVVVQIGGDIQADREIDAAGKLLLPGGVARRVPRWVAPLPGGRAAALGGRDPAVANTPFRAPGGGLRAGVARDARVAAHPPALDFSPPPVLKPQTTERQHFSSPTTF